MVKIPFHKMHGCGNDFILMDASYLAYNQYQYSNLAVLLCQFHTGIGADGLILLEKKGLSEDLPYRWHFYNSDGSRGEMCGNGARCAAWLAHQMGWAAEIHSFGIDEGVIEAEVFSLEKRVKITMPKPERVNLNDSIDINYEHWDIHTLWIGVPHLVAFVDNVDEIDIHTVGYNLLNEQKFAPQKINSNFVQILDKNTILIRTFERGVNAETFACGTGCTATAVVAQRLNLVNNPTTLITKDGTEMIISHDGEHWYLSGPVKYVFEGYITESYINDYLE